MTEQNGYDKILIIQTASIGDVILATSLVETLHASHPDIRIDFLVKEGCDGILQNNPHLHTIWVWKKKERKYRSLVTLVKKIRREHYDVVVDVHRFASSGFLTTFSKARIRSGFSKNPWSLFFNHRTPHYIGKDGMHHEIERNHQLIRFMGSDAPARPKVYPSFADFEVTRPYKSHPYITIAPMSLWYTKQFPESRWIELIRAIPASVHIYLLGSASDKEATDRIALQSGHEHCINLASKLSLLQTAALMRDALMNFTNDSAPLHLAGAIDAPLTAIFCSTVPAFGFGPLGDHALVVETEQALACRPCGLHGLKSCPENTMACANTISLQKLTERIPYE